MTSEVSFYLQKMNSRRRKTSKNVLDLIWMIKLVYVNFAVPKKRIYSNLVHYATLQRL